MPEENSPLNENTPLLVRRKNTDQADFACDQYLVRVKTVALTAFFGAGKLVASIGQTIFPLVMLFNRFKFEGSYADLLAVVISGFAGFVAGWSRIPPMYEEFYTSPPFKGKLNYKRKNFRSSIADIKELSHWEYLLIKFYWGLAAFTALISCGFAGLNAYLGGRTAFERSAVWFLRYILKQDIKDIDQLDPSITKTAEYFAYYPMVCALISFFIYTVMNSSLKCGEDVGVKTVLYLRNKRNDSKSFEVTDNSANHKKWTRALVTTIGISIFMLIAWGFNSFYFARHGLRLFPWTKDLSGKANRDISLLSIAASVINFCISRNASIYYLLSRMLNKKASFFPHIPESHCAKTGYWLLMFPSIIDVISTGVGAFEFVADAFDEFKFNMFDLSLSWLIILIISVIVAVVMPFMLQQYTFTVRQMFIDLYKHENKDEYESLPSKKEGFFSLFSRRKKIEDLEEVKGNSFICC